MGTLLLGLLAGTLSTLSPCVLPILPFVVLGALDQHPLGPVALAGGLVAAFTGAALVVSGVGLMFDVSGEALRMVAALMLVAFGVILLSSVLQQRLAAIGAPVTDFLQGVLYRFTPSGLPGQFALGALLGVVWTPCTGPTLGAAVTLAASSGTLARAAFVMLFFGMGASLPLLAIAYGSRQTLKSRRNMLVSAGRAAKPAFGMLLAGTGLLVLSGADKAAESMLVDSMPDWLVALTTRF